MDIVHIKNVIGSNNTKHLKKLLEDGFPPDGDSNEWFTPIHYAAENKSMDCIEILAQFGANINLTSKAMNAGHYSPLFIATVKGNHEVMTLLLLNGANPDWRIGLSGDCAMNYALNNGYCVRDLLFIKQCGASIPKSHRAIFSSKSESTRSRPECWKRGCQSCHHPEDRITLNSIIGDVLSLAELSRVTIRKHTRLPLKENLKKLPLPLILKNYLSFSHHITDVVSSSQDVKTSQS